jgi:hypothetical protein
MKKIVIAAISAALVLCVGVASAQEDSDSRRFVPVETWTCNYNDGKSMADLKPVIADWNEWADSQNFTDYFAAVVTPHFYGEYPFDIGWIGAWKDANAMGAGLDAWVNDGSDVSAMFFEVINCDSHSNFASTLIKPPKETDDDDQAFVMDFSNCSIREGKTFDEVMAGMEAWAKHQTENGFTNSTYAMFPVYGESNNDYAFKLVEGHDDHASSGAGYELMGNGGHWRKQRELLGELVDCDITRVYNALQIRDWADDE